MAEIRIQPQKNGPYMVEGLVTLVDYEGRPYQTKEKMWLCRCGGSSNKPFCDATHKRKGFQAEERAPEADAGAAG